MSGEKKQPERRFRPSLNFDELWAISLALESAEFADAENEEASKTAAKKIHRIIQRAAL